LNYKGSQNILKNVLLQQEILLLHNIPVIIINGASLIIFER